MGRLGGGGLGFDLGYALLLTPPNISRPQIGRPIMYFVEQIDPVDNGGVRPVRNSEGLEISAPMPWGGHRGGSNQPERRGI